MADADSNRWFAPLGPSVDGAVRLFGFSHAGGGALAAFRPWVPRLPKTCELHAVLYPGHEQRLREPLVRSMGALTEALADAMAPRLDRPFVFFGHSMGALVGFELARTLRARGRPGPAHLFVAACRSPEMPLREAPLSKLPAGAFRDAVVALGGIPRELLDREDLLELVLPMLRADFEVCETYAYASGAPLDCPITVLGGDRDRLVLPADLEGWRAQTAKEFRRLAFEGDHFFVRGAMRPILEVVGAALAPLAG